MSRAKDPITGLTAKQEAFAQAVASGLNQSDAYRQAYNVSPDSSGTTIWDEASTIARHPLVAPRIQALKLAVQERFLADQAWTRSRLVSKLDRNAEAAYAAEQFAPSNRALELIGKATGILVDTPSQPQAAIQIVFITEGRASVPLSVDSRVVEGLPPALGEEPIVPSSLEAPQIG